VRELLERSDDLELEYLIAVEPLDEAVNAVKAAAQPAVLGGAKSRRRSSNSTPAWMKNWSPCAPRGSKRCAALAPELLKRYEAALARAGTSGASQIVSGRCDGCRIALSPLDLDRWKGQPEGAFMNCPECGRLLMP